MSIHPASIAVTRGSSTSSMTLPGRVDADLERAFVECAEEAMEGDVRRLVVSFALVETLTSAGVGLLIGLLRDAQTRGVALAYRDLEGDPRHVAERSGLLRFVEVEESPT